MNTGRRDEGEKQNTKLIKVRNKETNKIVIENNYATNDSTKKLRQREKQN
jgi:hypothetical protein